MASLPLFDQELQTWIDASTWEPSCYWPIVCISCHKRPLTRYAVAIRECWVREPSSLIPIWSRVGIVRDCCKRTIESFIASDEWQLCYDDANTMQPPDFTFDDFVKLRDSKIQKETMRCIPTHRYNTQQN